MKTSIPCECTTKEDNNYSQKTLYDNFITMFYNMNISDLCFDLVGQIYVIK